MKSLLTLPSLFFLPTRQTGFDGDRGAGSLFETWTAKDAMQQRRGRAGRVKPGICYRLVTRRLYESLPEHTLPEISRSPLDSLVLMVKVWVYFFSFCHSPYHELSLTRKSHPLFSLLLHPTRLLGQRIRQSSGLLIDLPRPPTSRLGARCCLVSSGHPSPRAGYCCHCKFHC